MIFRTSVAAAVTLIGSVLLSTSYAAESSFTFPDSGLKVDGRVTFLAIDDQGLGERDGLTLTLNKPTVRKEPVLKPETGNLSAPDSMAAHFYGTVLHDGDKFRMYYYAVSYREGAPGNLWQGPVCYAESTDGLNWIKPKLGQVEIDGSADNNALKLSDEATQCAAVVIDEKETDPKKRYKMVYMAFSHTWTFRTATSADGITWEVQEKRPSDKFLEMGSFYRFGDQWVVHGQGIGADAEGNPEGRQGYASVSSDFVNWEINYLETFRARGCGKARSRGGLSPGAPRGGWHQLWQRVRGTLGYLAQPFRSGAAQRGLVRRGTDYLRLGFARQQRWRYLPRAGEGQRVYF